MTTDTKKTEKSETPPPAILIFGPPNSGKTALIDLMVKFYGSTSVEDSFTLGKDGEKDCRWERLKAGTLYITNETFDEMDIVHAGMGHGVVVASIYDVLQDLGRAKGRTAVQYFTEQFLTRMLDDALRMPGPRRGGGAPRGH